ncbi:hypothetical protein [Mucilaginibacter polytrichastri]|uniref:PD-(D/E)XK endonuclease-like domain-containing protein n=1 Tax=Mucilaginibacter polytrichastri TaxID=1302689 RepID=A0A1Q5ZS45_9SPHI|nr:hypothetical protein [Mucilaginibacter polytrichastri]OKS84592.1 hypothetical protein RG47T_0024 [Mucilaginibacter polytrichastri]SFT02574.1 hypothetical protein SAMN04487890_108211 [Mucilaginibacter polytrichastri]
MNVKWAYTTVNTWRECNRKYYFASVLANHNRKNLVRRKAYELRAMQNLTMWKGSVVDKFLEVVIIPMITAQKELDFQCLSEQAVAFARKQFRFSENKLYDNPELKKGDIESEYCILDIHETGQPYTEQDLLVCYDDIRKAILNIPLVVLPDGRHLMNLLKEANWLKPNVEDRLVYVGNAIVKPQMDLLVSDNWKPVIIDWKLSDSMVSDYARQLQISGLTIYKKRLDTPGKPPYLFEDIGLLEVNLLKGIAKHHDFNQEIYNNTIDYISLTSRDIALMTGEDIDIEDFELTNNQVSCKNCNFRLLCGYLIKNNNIYDEGSYLKSVPDRQLV